MNRNGAQFGLRRQQAWVLAVGVLFLADFVFYGYMPSHRRLASLARIRRQHEQVISAATAKAEALPTLEERYKETARTVRYYENCVPSESALGVFLGQIANIMTEHELINEVVQPGREVRADELNCIPVHMKCMGTLAAVFGFFNDLQSLHRLVRIEKITLNNDGTYTGTVVMQADAVIFYRPQKDPPSESLVGKRDLETTNNGA